MFPKYTALDKIYFGIKYIVMHVVIISPQKQKETTAEMLQTSTNAQ